MLLLLAALACAPDPGPGDPPGATTPEPSGTSPETRPIDPDCPDVDGDGWGAPPGDGSACRGGLEPGDCDDTRTDVFPGAADVACDGVDASCDGADPCLVPVADDATETFTAAGLWAAAGGDHDGDGRDDVYVSLIDYYHDYVTVTARSGGWTGKDHPVTVVIEDVGEFVASAGDVDGDGTEELWVWGGAGVSPLLFGAPFPEKAWRKDAIGRFPTDVDAATAGDLDGDGLAETLFTLGEGEHALVTPTVGGDADVGDALVTVVAGCAAALPGDLDGDGIGEIASVGCAGSGFVSGAVRGTVHEEDLDVSLGAHVDALAGVDDADGDGRADLVVSDGAVHLLVGLPATGTVDPPAAAASTFSTGRAGYWEVADVGDRDGDGLSEVACGDWGAGYVLPGAARGQLVPMDALRAWSWSTDDPLARAGGGDVDGDGRPDIVVATGDTYYTGYGYGSADLVGHILTEWP